MVIIAGYWKWTYINRQLSIDFCLDSARWRQIVKLEEKAEKALPNLKQLLLKFENAFTAQGIF